MKNNIFGIIVYLVIAYIFGGFVAFIVGMVHEDNDRCTYYSGKWSYGDLAIVFVSSIIGGILHNHFNYLGL